MGVSQGSGALVPAPPVISFGLFFCWLVLSCQHILFAHSSPGWVLALVFCGLCSLFPVGEPGFLGAMVRPEPLRLVPTPLPAGFCCSFLDGHSFSSLRVFPLGFP